MPEADLELRLRASTAALIARAYGLRGLTEHGLDNLLAAPLLDLLTETRTALGGGPHRDQAASPAPADRGPRLLAEFAHWQITLTPDWYQLDAGTRHQDAALARAFSALARLNASARNLDTPDQWQRAIDALDELIAQIPPEQRYGLDGLALAAFARARPRTATADPSLMPQLPPRISELLPGDDVTPPNSTNQPTVADTLTSLPRAQLADPAPVRRRRVRRTRVWRLRRGRPRPRRR